MKHDEASNAHAGGELGRIRDAYAKRAARSADGDARAARLGRWMVRERLPVWLEALDRAPGTRATRRVLEIGCGGGGNLALLLAHGYEPANLVGNELLAERAAAARRALPEAVVVHAGDASAIDFPEAPFDAVLQSTVFTSILDEALRRRLAARMWSLVKPGGGVLWYDFIVDNPRNPDVRGVSVDEAWSLFPEADRAHSFVRRATLAPPLGRTCARLGESVGAIAYRALGALPFLRTHVVMWIGKPEDARETGMREVRANGAEP